MHLTEDGSQLAGLIDVVSAKTDPADYPHADAVEQGVLIYDSARLAAAADAAGRRDVAGN